MSSARTGGVRCDNCLRRDCGTLGRQRYPDKDTLARVLEQAAEALGVYPQDHTE